MRAELDTPISFANAIDRSRPFDEMDQAILERLNALVKVNDILYFLGDFCMGSQARVVAYRR
jgi:calcineurin-like phosphoesterase family protein